MSNNAVYKKYHISVILPTYNERENLPLVLEPGTIKIEIFKDSMRSSKITGTKSNEDFFRYVKQTKSFYVELDKIQSEKLKEIDKNKEEILHKLTEEIVKRYYYDKGVYMQKALFDTNIMKAMSILNNNEAYISIFKKE